MSLTQVTSNVIQDDTIKPNKLTTGGPVWDSAETLSAVGFAGDGSRLSGLLTTVPLESVIHAVTGAPIPGIITALGFIGDGSQLTDVTPALSVIEVTDNILNISPQYNNTVVLLNSLSTINIFPEVDNLDLVPGHKTYFVQTNTGRGKFNNLYVYSVNNFYETRRQYSVCELEFLGFQNGWTLYGDLTSIALTPGPLQTTIPASFSAVNAGYDTFALSGTVLYATGRNINGGLGLNDRNSRSLFTRVVTPTNARWTSIVTMSDQSLALSGTDLYVVGGNAGYLGLNDTNDRSTFTRVIIPTDAKWSALGKQYVDSGHVFVLSGTDLYVSGGFNTYGQLGLNDIIPRSTFTRINIPANPKWNYITTGSDTSYALSGTDLYSAGINSYGQLGLNIASSNPVLLLSENARSTFTRVTIPANSVWTDVVAGLNTVYALSGTDLYVCGQNEQGQLGLGDTNNRSTFTRISIPTNGVWTAIACGQSFIIALSGTDLYGCGRNDQGQLGLGDTNNRSTFTRISIPTNGVWTAIACGTHQSFALSGTNMFGTGSNGVGQLGLGDTLNRLTFTRISAVAV